ncbi:MULTISPECIES: calcium-binding protein [Neisseria]|uniref:calcium-binding protein n=1 Tax=Neisseria TaxID=482 RepID=UPI001E32AAB1|nr:MULTISPECIES: calcium-binding protein [Neisseria]
MCEDCVDDQNQENTFGGKDTNPGNVINVVKPEDGASHTEGTAVKDTIYGTDGEDVIYGKDGTDVIYGGPGNDTIKGDNDGDSLYGEAGKDYLNGGTGNDYLNGGTGADIMRGGDGGDAYYVDNVGDEVIEDGNLASGHDAVRSEIDYTLPKNVEDLYLQGDGDINGTGNELNNTINGNSGNNKLFGMDGDDCLVGKDGNDYLDGGLGDDVLIGGLGNDTYFFDKGYGYDIIEDNGGDGTLVFGEGFCLEDVILCQEGDDLSITFANSSDSILVGDWFVGSDNQIETFKFSDGTSYQVGGYSTGALALEQIQEQTQAAIA